jgi:hypothetical protein
MRTRRRSPAGRPDFLGVVMFGSVGWLFADLMAALAMAFLVANTVGASTPPRPSKPHVKPHVRPTPTPTPTPTQGPALDLNYVCVDLTFDDPQGLIDGDQAEVSSVQNQITGQPALESQQAGLVLLFGGDPDSPAGDSEAKALDEAVIHILRGLGQRDSVFGGTVVYREFLGLDQPQTSVQLNVYVFKPQHGASAPSISATTCKSANSSG